MFHTLYIKSALVWKLMQQIISHSIVIANGSTMSEELVLYNRVYDLKMKYSIFRLILLKVYKRHRRHIKKWKILNV